MMDRRAWLLIALLLIAGGAKLMWKADPSSRPTPDEVVARPSQIDSSTLAPGEPPVAEPVRSDAALEPLPLPSTEIDPERLAMIERDARLRDAARQQLLAREADARWETAVDTGEYHARDLDPGIRRLFSSMRLEPRYVPGGRIDGLRIEELPRDNALAQVGFQVGDRLTRIQGVELRDPAEIPALLDRLGPHVSFCAERGGSEVCRELELD